MSTCWIPRSGAWQCALKDVRLGLCCTASALQKTPIECTIDWIERYCPTRTVHCARTSTSLGRKKGMDGGQPFLIHRHAHFAWHSPDPVPTKSLNWCLVFFRMPALVVASFIESSAEKTCSKFRIACLWHASRRIFRRRGNTESDVGGDSMSRWILRTWEEKHECQDVYIYRSYEDHVAAKQCVVHLASFAPSSRSHTFASCFCAPSLPTTTWRSCCRNRKSGYNRCRK